MKFQAKYDRLEGPAATSESAAESPPGTPTAAAAETTAPTVETTAAVISSPPAAAESPAGPVSPPTKHRVEAGSALGRRRPILIIAAETAPAVKGTRRPLGLETSDADRFHTVTAGVQLAELAHHLFEG